MTVTVTPTAQPTNTPPRVQLAITTTTETSTTVVRNNPDGSQSIVRTSDGGPLPVSGGTATLYDYEAPSGAPVTYSSYESPATVSGAVTVSVSQIWLIHPGVPTLSQPIRLRPGSLVKNTYPIARGVFRPMGRSNAVVVTGGVRNGASGTFTVLTQSTAALATLNTLLGTGSALLLNIPATGGYTFPTSYVAIGDVTQQPAVGDKLTELWMDTICTFDEVDAPSGGTQATRTYVDLLNYATYGALTAAYPSYAALLAGP